jgi:hypothetical protein
MDKQIEFTVIPDNEGFWMVSSIKEYEWLNENTKRLLKIHYENKDWDNKWEEVNASNVQ